MEGRGAAIRVGLFLVVTIVALLALIWFLRGGQVQNGTLLVTYFSESVQGLQVGSEVEYRGVNVGRVTQLGVVGAVHGAEAGEVLNPLYRQVFVRYLIDPNRIGKFASIEDAVKSGLRARLNSSLITGIAYIDLDFVNPEEHPAPKLPWTPDYPFVPSIPSALAQVQNAGQALLAKLDKVDMAGLVASLGTLAERLNQELAPGGDVHETLASAQGLFNSAGHAVTRSNFPGLTADLRKLTGQLSALADDPDLKKLLANGALATDRLSQLTGQMSKLITTLDGTVREISASANQLQSGLAPMLRNMQAASENVRELTSTLRQYPGLILSGPPPEVRGNLK
ncbi:MAG TPA: MlaD family protein [Acetobacteraceae bacterium]|nr:MlaD family protein [Acetobacteraceae bacterium]